MFLCYTLPNLEVYPMLDENIKENEEVEVKEETPAPEQPVEEKSYDKVVEEARKELYKSYTMSRRISNILMFVVVGAIVGIMFLIINNNQVLKIVGYSLAGALLIGMVLYYVLNRKRFPNKTKEYVALVARTMNNEMFKNQEFAEIASDPEEKLALDDLVGDGVYNEATGVNSRNVVRGTYKKHHFLYAEAALTRPSTRKQQVPPLFVGKYISAPNNMKFDGRFVVVIKNPKEPLDLPNAISDLAVLEDKDEFMVYGPEGASYRDVINNKVISQLKKLQIGGHLLNANVVFWSGHSAAYVSYDDTIMSVPFDKPLDKAGFDQSFKDLLACFNALTEE